MDVCRRQLPRDSIRISKERNTITKCWPSQDDVYVAMRDWSGWPKEGGAGSAKPVGVFGTAPQARQRDGEMTVSINRGRFNAQRTRTQQPLYPVLRLGQGRAGWRTENEGQDQRGQQVWCQSVWLV